MRIAKISLIGYVILLAVVFIIIFLAASPLPESSISNGSTNASAEDLDTSVYLLAEDLKHAREETENLRRLMWGATAKNSREIESLKNALSLQQSADESYSGDTIGSSYDPSGGISSDSIPAQLTARGNWSEPTSLLRSPELEAFEAILTPEQRSEWSYRVDEQYEKTKSEAMANIPDDLRSMVAEEIKDGMEEMRNLIKYSILDQMLSEAKLREALEYE